MASSAWVSTEELALELDLPITTLYAWRMRRVGPKAVKLGRHLRYRRADVDAWVDEQDRLQNGDTDSPI